MTQAGAGPRKHAEVKGNTPQFQAGWEGASTTEQHSGRPSDTTRYPAKGLKAHPLRARLGGSNFTGVV